jgi:hypothetical protein
MTYARRKTYSLTGRERAQYKPGHRWKKSPYLLLAMVLSYVVFVAFAQKARHSMVAHFPAAREIGLAMKGMWQLIAFLSDITF